MEEEMLGSSAATSGDDPLRVFFIPFFVPSHILPMAKLALLFAARPGVEPTMLLTPANAALVRPTLASAPRPVRLLLYPFPSADSGLPPGLENLASVPAADSWRVDRAVDLVRPDIERLIRDHRPDAVVADVHFWWTTAAAAAVGVPRVSSHWVGVFSQCVMTLLAESRAQDAAAGETEPFVVPGLPGPPVELVRSETPDFLKTRDHFTEAWGRIKEAQRECYGSVVNTFYELEPAYCDLYRRTHCRRGWFVGPVSLYHAVDGEVAAERGGYGDEGRRCMRWLETKEAGSVVFVCFGSWCYIADEQLREIALGLEASGKPFLWVVRDSGGGEWMPEGWELRVEGRGMVVRGWAPQAAILAQPAVGAFLSHCGWNSVLEATAAGVPMLTWPLVFDMFINERLVVGVARTGARVWDGFRSTVEAERVVVPAEAIRRAVVRFMEGGGGEARAQARELAAKAKAAVAEGGSSRDDLDRLIDGLMEERERRRVCHVDSLPRSV